MPAARDRTIILSAGGSLSAVAFGIPIGNFVKSSIAYSPIPQRNKLDFLACGMPPCDAAADCFSILRRWLMTLPSIWKPAPRSVQPTTASLFGWSR